MLDRLSDAMRTEVETLATQYGRPLLRAQDISAQVVMLHTTRLDS